MENSGEQNFMKSKSTAAKRWSILFGVCILLIGASALWWLDGTSPVDPQDNAPVIFVVEKGEGARAIATNLAEERVIRSPIVFFLLVKAMGIERNLQAGDFRLYRTMTTQDVAKELTHGFLDVWVTTLEGWRVEEIANRLVKDLDIPEAEFLKVAQEGYMFPDTYLIPRDASASAIAKIFLDTFEEKVPEGVSEDVVTLASIVEREGRTDEDRPIIAGILRKRLDAGWPLQADATLQYALGYQSNEKSWWKKSLTSQDKKIRSPYNTYLNPGLPPGPIANPGLSAIRAVLTPEETEYWYYLHDPDGGVHYGRTLEEHEANIDRFLSS